MHLAFTCTCGFSFQVVCFCACFYQCTRSSAKTSQCLWRHAPHVPLLQIDSRFEVHKQWNYLFVSFHVQVHARQLWSSLLFVTNESAKCPSRNYYVSKQLKSKWEMYVLLKNPLINDLNRVCLLQCQGYKTWSCDIHHYRVFVLSGPNKKYLSCNFKGLYLEGSSLFIGKIQGKCYF